MKKDNLATLHSHSNTKLLSNIHSHVSWVLSFHSFHEFYVKFL